MTSRRLLVPGRWRPGLAVLATLAAVVLVVLGIRAYERPRLTQFDHAAARWVTANLPHLVMHGGLELTRPVVDVVVLAAVVVWAGVRRRLDVAVLSVLGPTVAVLLTEWVGKPLVDDNRPYGLAYPSGHETGFTAMAAVLGVLLIGASGSTAVRVAGAVVLLALVLLTSCALIYYRLHLATETVGGITMGLAIVPATALAIDAVARRQATRSAR